MTTGQKEALKTLSPQFIVEPEDKPINFETLFSRKANTILEIGFGMGQSLVQMAELNLETNFLGVEVHLPGVGRLVRELDTVGLTNVKAVHGDAIALLSDYISDNSLFGIHIYFPDPWHKKKHHKRRLIQPDFVKLLCQKLGVGGYIHLATDWAPYAEHMTSVLSNEPDLEVGDATLVRPETRFEQRGKRLGHQIDDLIYKKRG